MEKMGKYPVIFLSLKAAKQPDFHMSYEVLKSEIAKEYERHRYVLESENLISSYKEQYRKLMNQRADKAEYSQSLKFLSLCLEKYHGSKAVILIDEYDVPLENAYFRGFYEEMLDFIRPFLEAGLKTNASLEFSVITGQPSHQQGKYFYGTE